jgi:polysaccharide export outer membrane protein
MTDETQMNTARCFATRIVASFLAIALLEGCTPGGSLPILPAYDGQVYHLGVDDQLRIITYGDPQLSDKFSVDDAGDIEFPLLGVVPAVGLTTHDLSTKLMAGLKSQYVMKEPSVSVEVIAYRPVFILGEVSKPGQYPYIPGMSVLSAVAIAGGYTYRAWQGTVGVVRSDGKNVQVGRAETQAFVAPGDVITVFQRPF